MSAIAAVFGIGGQDAAGAVTRMLDAAAHRAPGPSRVWPRGPAAVGLRAGAGSIADPVIDAQTGNAIVFDGRLDNVDELSAALGLSPHPGSEAIVLAAYERWRESMPARLLGDFAFVIWDGGAERLFCARDVFGQRPLFYATTSSGVAIGSEPQQVLTHRPVAAAINEGVVAEHLAGRPTSVEETVWRDVRRLAPAHALSVSASGVRVFRYWDLSGHGTVQCADDDREYAARFADLFRTAVRCRVRGAGRGVGVFLSGGIDSSAIAAVAARLHRSEGLPQVRAYSVTYPHAACHETPYIDAVVQRWNLPSARIEGAATPLCRIVAEIARHQDLPAFPNGSSLDPLRARAALDVDVVLTGYGGDEWLTGTPRHATDLIRRGRLFAAAKEWWAEGSRRGGGAARIALLRHVAAPLVPQTIKPLARALAGGAPPSREWIRPEFARRVALQDRLRQRPRARFATLVQRDIHAIVNSALQVIGDELEERAAAAAGLEQRQPFNDRRVAEFGFALPQSQRRIGAETKVVIRRALGEDLPPIVRRRRDKGEFSATFAETLLHVGRSFFVDLRIAEVGWVDPEVVLAQYDRLAALYRDGNAAYIAFTGPVWAVTAVELWFRHIQGVTS